MAKNAFTYREEWLQAAIRELRTHFDMVGFPLPEKIRAAIGFPSKGAKSSCVGECWASVASLDQHHEIFIRPDKSDPQEVLGILCHELVHAAVPLGSGHGPVFKEAAIKVGLIGKMREAMPGPVLQEKLGNLIEDLGDLPHASLDIEFRETAPRKKQTTRMLKASCPADDCDYTVRLTAVHAKKAPPICGIHKIEMLVDWPEEPAEIPPPEEEGAGEDIDVSETEKPGF